MRDRYRKLLPKVVRKCVGVPDTNTRTCEGIVNSSCESAQKYLYYVWRSGGDIIISTRPGVVQGFYYSPNLSGEGIMRCLFAVMSIVMAVSAQQSISVYHIGNSWTDCSYGMHDIAEGFGKEAPFGRNMIPGAPLEWLWDHPNDGFGDPSGYTEALPSGQWDCVVLQPWMRPLSNTETYAKKFADLAFGGNPNTMLLIMSTEKSELSLFETLVDHLKDAYPGKTIGIVPYGHCVARAKSQIGGEWYDETDHPNSKGKYVMACAHYAAIFQADPHGAVISGLRYWRGPYSVEQSFAEQVWDIVWDEVQTNPYCKLGTTAISVPLPSILAGAETKSAASTYSVVGARGCLLSGRLLSRPAAAAMLPVVGGSVGISVQNR